MIAALFWLLAQTTPAPAQTAAPSCAREASVVELPESVMPSDFPKGATVSAIVMVTVDPQGVPIKIQIYKSTANPITDRLALLKAKAAVYSPKVVDCKPTTGVYMFDVNFPPG